MFDLSWAELLVIFAVALIFIGPKDIPNIAYQIGKFFRRLKYMQFALTNQFEDFMKQTEVRENSTPDQSDEKQQVQSKTKSDIETYGHEPDIEYDPNKRELDYDPYDEAEADVDLLEIMPLPQDENKDAEPEKKSKKKGKA